MLPPTSQVNYKGSDVNISALGACSTTHVRLRILAFSEENAPLAQEAEIIDDNHCEESRYGT